MFVPYFLMLSCGESTPKAQFNHQIFQDLENGDIVCRMGTDLFSNSFKRCSSTEFLYSHVGIVKKMGDSIFVIHAEANEFTGIGYVKREIIESFLLDVKNWGVYRLDAADSTRNRIEIEADRYLQKHTPFDIDFDATNDDKLYCTELVAMSINKSVGNQLIKPRTQIGGITIYGVDDVYLLPEIKVVKKSAN